MMKAYVHNKGKLLSYQLTLVYPACTWTFVDSFKHLLIVSNIYSQTVTLKTDSFIFIGNYTEPTTSPSPPCSCKGRRCSAI